ncbi:MAG: hypothetical protein DRO87_01005 [Candidatus Thorarchaeota archaeon]|nr:MAG: hypothetical protein DRP09_02655 [Candidatus Thorarchaeota archaeon]RLI60018.1 MAG: hypothetical protein DRO87_01005 [Candidatus Thorarchaeota archaeon]
MKPDCEKRVRNDVMAYRKNVAFFSVFSKVLDDNGIVVRIESQCRQRNGNKCFPDFRCSVDGKRVLFEHKGALSEDARHIQKVIKKTERYLNLMPDDQADAVVLLVPSKSSLAVRKILETLETDLVIWEFDFNMDKLKVFFNEIHNELSVGGLRWLLETEHSFIMATCSLIQFLREDPPVVYTASVLLNVVLRSFIDAWDPPETPFDVQWTQLLSRAKGLFPGGKSSNQITAPRVRKALELLDDAGWVSYPTSHSNVTVKRTKRLRRELVSDSLIKAYCEREEGKQTSLDDFDETRETLD